MGFLFNFDNGGFNGSRRVDMHPSNDGYNMHAHERIEIYCFVSGYCRYIVEGNEYSLKPYDIMIMRPSETHRLKVMGDVPYERFAFHITPDYFKGIDPDGELLKPFFDRPLGKMNKFSMEDFDTDLYKNCLDSINFNNDLSNRLEIELKLLTVLTEISKAYYHRIAHFGSQENDEARDTSAKIIEYINQNIFEPLSLSVICDKFFISQSQLNRIFKKATGSSVWEYISIKRLLSARNFIRAGEPAGKVCIKCGFKDYSSFYRMYKSRFGVSPKQDDVKK